MPKKLKEVLADAGVSMDFEVGGHAPKNLVDREIKKDVEAKLVAFLDAFAKSFG